MERTAHHNAIVLPRLRAFLECPDLFEHALPDGTPLFQTSNEVFDITLPPASTDGPRRFGHEMERYMAAWLEGNQRYELLLQNVQIVSDGITLGELDYVVRDVISGEVIHIELAYKFYILAMVAGGPKWIGPNHRDDLDSKLYKLQHRQFPLLMHPLCQKALDALGIEAASVKQMACLKGQLFLPKGHAGPLPGEVNQAAVCGTWTTISELESMLNGEEHYCLPAKMDWVLPPESGKEWLSASNAYEALKAHGRAQLCWVRYADGSHERLMVVHS